MQLNGASTGRDRRRLPGPRRLEAELGKDQLPAQSAGGWLASLLAGMEAALSSLPRGGWFN